MLPSHKILNEFFKDNFVFYRPKDIISGDFYWATRKNDQLFIAAADCTGHGVPGALMSMIGISFLRQVINEMNITEPSNVLNKVHEMVVSALNEDLNSVSSKDGMDIALLRIDLGMRTVSYSGAVRPLYVADKNGLNILRGDRFSIGGVKSMTESFTQHEISLQGSTSLYLFSDGFPDQFGEKTGKKFMVKNLQRLIEEMYTMPMQEQHKKITSVFNEWKGSAEQTDDIMVIGLKL
jgi:serine phosphatase RsbU (regulator of sigma subunit)